MNAEQVEAIKKNATLTTIYERRAVRRYKDRKVEREMIEQILDAGRMAPSAINKQPWKFYILDDRVSIRFFSGQIAKVAEKFFHLSHGVDLLKAEDPIFHGAPVVIFITSPKDSEWAMIDIGMCAENMMLAAKSLGLDSCPVGMAKYVEQSSACSKLKVPGGEQVNLAIVFGYGDESPEVHERRLDNVFYIK